MVKKLSVLLALLLLFVGSSFAEGIPQDVAVAYLEIVKDIEGEPAEWSEWWDFGVALHDITGDGIPELFCAWMPDVQSESLTLTVWTWQDGQALQIFSDWITPLGPGDIFDFINTIFYSQDRGLCMGARYAYDDYTAQHVFRRYALEDGLLQLTGKIEMAFDQEAFDRDFEADQVRGSIGEYMAPCRDGIQLTWEALQSESESLFAGAEVILFGDSWGEPKVTMSYADAIAYLGGAE